MRRLLCTVLAVAALAVPAAPAGAQDAAAEDVDVATQIAPFPDDGGTCTGVPDTIPGIFDFTDACAAHDECYASGGQTQAQCDESLRQDMVATCAVQHPSALDAGRYLCLTFAQLYFFGVRLFGGFFF